MEQQDTIRLKAFSGERDGWHTINLSAKTCGCPEFSVNAGRCQHLDALGIFRVKPFTPSTHPTFSQALSGLVKSLRIRRLDETIYWLVYLDTFRGPEFRFRVARRLLIGSAEDGHSVAVMEKMGERFGTLLRSQAQLIDLVKEAVRICKLCNWWHPASGGPDYIYKSMIGQRQWWYRSWDRTVPTLQREIEIAVEQQDAAMAIGGVMQFTDLPVRFSATRQAEFLMRLALSMKHHLAARLCRFHLSAKSALSGDNNALCQAAWLLAGGVSPIADEILPVSVAETFEVLNRARESWSHPHPIPRFCCDGVHSSGDDTRFTGFLAPMLAVCNAYRHYGRLDPADEWLPQFQCYDGLIIEGDDNPAGEV